MLERNLGNIGAILSKFADVVKITGYPKNGTVSARGLLPNFGIQTLLFVVDQDIIRKSKFFPR